MEKEFLRKRKVEILRQAKMGHSCACIKLLYASRSLFSYEEYCKVFTRSLYELFSHKVITDLLEFLKQCLPCDVWTWLNTNFYYYFNCNYLYYGCAY